MPTTTVIILTANRRPLLEKCLRSLELQTLAPSEVVVIDNRSEDDTADFLAAYRGLLALKVLKGTGASYAEARNQGIAAASSEWIAFLDDDCEADAPWLERLHAAAECHGWVSVGGPLLPADELVAPADYSPELAWAAGLSPPGIFGPLAGRRYLPATANLMFRRDLVDEFPFQSVGGNFGGAAGDYEAGREDAQWWRSLRRAGRPVGIEPRAIAWHHVGQDRLDMGYLRRRIEADGRAHWRREHPRDEVVNAAADMVHAPVNAVRSLFEEEGRAGERWAATWAWAARQRAFLNAAIDDPVEPVAPTVRSAAAVRAAGGLAVAGGKSLARTLGVPIVKSARKTRPLPDVEHPPERIIVVVHDLLGDAVLTLPMLRQLADAFDRSELILLTGPVAGPLLRANLPKKIKVIQLLAKATGRRPGAAMELHRTLSRFDPDVILIAYCHGLHPAPFFLTGRVPVVGWPHDNGLRQKLWGDLLTHPVKKSQAKHEAAALLDLLSPFGIRTRLERPQVVPSDEASARVAKIIARADAGSYLVLHVEKDGREKFWPAANFREVAQHFAAVGRDVFLIGSRGGRGAAEPILGKPRIHSLHGLLDSDELSALLAGAGAFLGSDSGPAHVAESVGAPGFVIFGFDSPLRWGPLPDGVEGTPCLGVLRAGSGDWLEEERLGLEWDFATRGLTVQKAVEMLEKVEGRFSKSMGDKTR